MQEILDITYGLDEVDDVIVQLNNMVTEHAVIALVGEMGAGKTTLIAQWCHNLGVIEEVSSPTFSIIQEYSTPKYKEPIYHLDLYRINEFEELLDTGIEDVIEQEAYALMFLEWPQIAEPILPESKTLVFNFSKIGTDQRRLQISKSV